MAKKSNATAQAVTALAEAKKAEVVTPEVMLDGKNLLKQVGEDMASASSATSAGCAPASDFCGSAK